MTAEASWCSVLDASAEAGVSEGQQTKQTVTLGICKVSRAVTEHHAVMGGCIQPMISGTG